MASYEILLDQRKGQWWMSIDKAVTWRGPGDYPCLPVQKGETGEFSFTIESGPNFAVQPLGVSASASKKPKQGHIDGQITVNDRNETHLLFTDSNKSAGGLNYVLFFEDNSVLDPIISNGGPGKAQYLLYAFGAVLVIALGFAAFRAKQ